MALRLEAIALRLEAIALGLDAIAVRLEDIALRFLLLLGWRQLHLPVSLRWWPVVPRNSEHVHRRLVISQPLASFVHSHLITARGDQLGDRADWKGYGQSSQSGFCQCCSPERVVATRPWALHNSSTICTKCRALCFRRLAGLGRSDESHCETCHAKAMLVRFTRFIDCLFLYLLVARCY